MAVAWGMPPYRGTQGQKNGHADELHGQKICFLKSGIAQE
jgi:hypothetical protein